MNQLPVTETEKAREAFAARISGFPLIQSRQRDEDAARNLVHVADARHAARRFTGAAVTGWGAL